MSRITIEEVTAYDWRGLNEQELCVLRFLTQIEKLGAFYDKHLALGGANTVNHNFPGGKDEFVSVGKDLHRELLRQTPTVKLLGDDLATEPAE